MIRQAIGTITTQAEKPICLKVFEIETTFVRSVGSGEDGGYALRGHVAEGHRKAPEQVGHEDPYVDGDLVRLKRHIYEHRRGHDEQGKYRLCYHRFELALFALRAVDHVADERIENRGEDFCDEHENTDYRDIRAEYRRIKFRLIRVEKSDYRLKAEKPERICRNLLEAHILCL